MKCVFGETGRGKIGAAACVRIKQSKSRLLRSSSSSSSPPFLPTHNPTPPHLDRPLGQEVPHCPHTVRMPSPALSPSRGACCSSFFRSSSVGAACGVVLLAPPHQLVLFCWWRRRCWRCCWHRAFSPSSWHGCRCVLRRERVGIEYESSNQAYMWWVCPVAFPPRLAASLTDARMRFLRTLYSLDPTPTRSHCTGHAVVVAAMCCWTTQGS